MAVEVVLLELEPTVSNCEESLLFFGGETDKYVCSENQALKEWKDSFNMSVQNTLQINYRKPNQTIGGRFWLRLEGIHKRLTSQVWYIRPLLFEI